MIPFGQRYISFQVYIILDVRFRMHINKFNVNGLLCFHSFSVLFSFPVIEFLLLCDNNHEET